MKVSCVIPAHNEEGNIEVLVTRLREVLGRDELTNDYELVLVDDNSTDSTPGMADRLAASSERIKVIHRRESPGFGKALKAGLKAATGDIIIPVMGDLSDDPEDIPKLVERIAEGYDVAYGSRFTEGGRTEGYPPFKMFCNRLFNNVVRVMFGIRHKDVTNAFKAYRREVLEAIGFDNIDASGFDITIEIPLKAHIIGFRSSEVPVTWHGRERGISKLKLSSNGYIYGRRLLSLFIMGNAVALKDLFRAVVRGSPLRIIAAIVLGLTLLIGLFLISGWMEVFKILSTISTKYLLLACLATLSAFIFRTWRWSVLLRTTGHVIPRDLIFKCIMFGWFINCLLPARVGDLARGVALKTTRDLPLSVSIPTIVLERAIDMIVLALLLGITSIFFIRSADFMMVNLFAAALAVLLVASLLIAYIFDEFLIRKLKSRIGKIESALKTLKDVLKSFSNNLSALILCFIIAIPVWLLEILSIYLAARAVHFYIPYPVATLAGITSFVAQALPLTPAGIGVHEVSVVGVLEVFDVRRDVGTAIALVDHFARVVVVYLFGFLAAVHIGFESREYFKRLSRGDPK